VLKRQKRIQMTRSHLKVTIHVKLFENRTRDILLYLLKIQNIIAYINSTYILRKASQTKKSGSESKEDE